METWETELRRIEETVAKSDGDALRARHESGRFMITLKKGKKQLPKGMLAELVSKLGVARSEVNARMAFATKYATEVELSDVIGKFPTWYAITHGALTKTARAPKAPMAGVGDEEADRQRTRKAIHRVTEAVQALDPSMVEQPSERELLMQLAAAVAKLLASTRQHTKAAA